MDHDGFELVWLAFLLNHASAFHSAMLLKFETAKNP
jgi:hypothetical protein